MQQITILGSTGSVGVSTLDVVARHPELYSVFALSGRSSVATLAEQCARFQPTYAVVMDANAAAELRHMLSLTSANKTEVLWGVDALCQVSSDPAVDTVMAAIVGAAGLLPTLSAVKASKKVLLANKEALVMAGHLFKQALEASSNVLLPIDSEHNAIFQCLPHSRDNLPAAGVTKILLSASGGPFRGWTRQEMESVTPAQACAHPNWSMGSKISVDSATLMNKGLELIEACWLFDTTAEMIQVLVHPQSIVHSLVQYIDGSVLAQMGNPDMRTPIAHALAWPDRIESGVAELDLCDIAQLNFEAPDMENFPCLQLAKHAAATGRDAPVVLNAANEVAVDAFLLGRIGFNSISQVVAHCMDNWLFCEPDTIAAVQESDKRARRLATNYIAGIK